MSWLIRVCSECGDWERTAVLGLSAPCVMCDAGYYVGFEVCRADSADRLAEAVTQALGLTSSYDQEAHGLTVHLIQHQARDILEAAVMAYREGSPS